VLCKPAAVLSEEQSFAVQEVAEPQQRAASWGAEERTAELLVLQTPQSMVTLAQQALQLDSEELAPPQGAGVLRAQAEQRRVQQAFQLAVQPSDASAEQERQGLQQMALEVQVAQPVSPLEEQPLASPQQVGSPDEPAEARSQLLSSE
jgi:hypothetical protein